MPSEKHIALDRELILSKLGRLKEYLTYLKELEGSSLDDLLKDFKLRGAVERYLHTSIECVVDIGNEIISSLQLRRPERYRDIPFILTEAGAIPKAFARKVATMIGFRNILVHEYASIDVTLVHQFLQTRLSDFEVFMKHIAKFLSGKEDIL